MAKNPLSSMALILLLAFSTSVAAQSQKRVPTVDDLLKVKSAGGAQADFGVTPDVCTIGKSLGGGFPLSAFCGKAAIMDRFQSTGAT